MSNIVAIAIVAVLTVIALVLFLLGKWEVVSRRSLELWALIATIITMLVTIALFVFPPVQNSPQKQPQRSEVVSQEKRVTQADRQETTPHTPSQDEHDRPAVSEEPADVERLRPFYRIQEGQPIFVAPISTSVSVVFQETESVQHITLVIAPDGRDTLRRAAYGAGSTVEFETETSFYRIQILDIDWAQRKITVKITT